MLQTNINNYSRGKYLLAQEIPTNIYELGSAFPLATILFTALLSDLLPQP